MTSERWRQIQDLFYRIADAPTLERDAALAAADPEIRREVEMLLNSDGRGQQTIASAVQEGQGLLDDSPGQRFGPYAVVGRIGQGGMGVVYKAIRADQAYQKEVAIKVLHLGLDTPVACDRFRQERQILAALEHPNIARLLDGGETGQGQSYIVLDYVDGQNILDYANQNRLSIEERLRLFLPVCDAVQYAHQNLIVHRDLKPANILVTQQGVPKLLDFGIAKLLDAHVEITQTQARALTPQYASPEQVQGSSIGAASDVYALGVVLYELLTGRLPYEIKSPSLADLERIVCRVQAAPPAISDDLDNILLMALRKEPARRYASVRQFAEDIERALTDRPVLARPDTGLYRARKFIRRHRLSLSAVAAVIVSLAAGLTIALHEARLAEERFQEVRNLAKTFVFDVHDEIAKVPGTTKAREFVVATALQYLDRLALRAGNDAGLLAELAAAYQKIGDVQGTAGMANLGRPVDSLDSFRKALALLQRAAAIDPGQRAALASCHAQLGRIERDQRLSGPALADLDKATRLIDEVLRENPTSVQHLTEGGRIWRLMGMFHEERGAAAPARAAYLRAKSLLEALVLSTPTPEAKYRLSLAELDVGDAIKSTGDFEGGQAAYLRSEKLIDDALRRSPGNANYLRGLMVLYERLAEIYFEPVFVGLNDPLRALPYRQKQIAEWERLRKLDPNNVDTELGLAVSLFGAARAFAAVSLATGVQTAQRSLDMFDSLVRRYPNHKVAISRRPRAAVALSDLMLQAGHPVEAHHRAGVAVAAFRAMMAEEPGDHRVRAYLVLAHLASARALTATPQPAAAERELREAVRIAEPILQVDPPQVMLMNPVARAYESLGAHLAETGKRTEALACYEKALALWSAWKEPSKYVDRRRQEARASLDHLHLDPR